MWRMPYTIIRNLYRLQGILEKAHRIADRPEPYDRQQAYDHVRYIVSLMQKTGHIKTVSYGAGNLPAEGGYLLCPNHQGKYDAYGIVAVHEKPLSVVMERERSYFVLVDEIVRILRGRRMDSDNPRHCLQVLRDTAADLANGVPYILFPEGAYDSQKHNSLWEFKPGCFKAAVRAQVPIIPVALVDSYKAYDSWQLTPVKTQVHYLEPIEPAQYADMTTFQIRDLVKARIQTKLDELGCN